MEYKILYKDGRAKRAEMKTVHGTIQTPVFMNVGTVAAIKGAVSTDDLRTIGTQVELSNTYHLHVRTGDKLIRQFGGLHKFMNWDRPILTDSGGFQVFSLASLRKIMDDAGVAFQTAELGRVDLVLVDEAVAHIGRTVGGDEADVSGGVAGERQYTEPGAVYVDVVLLGEDDSICGEALLQKQLTAFAVGQGHVVGAVAVRVHRDTGFDQGDGGFRAVS